MSSIELKNVKKVYGDEVIIPNLNLKIEDGSFTVLVGPSGCGKSTTLRMIAGLESPSSGQIEIGGQDVVDMEPGKREIAMVFQNYALYPTMTVRENIEFGLVNMKVPKEERDRLIREVTETVGLEKYLERKPGQLSGGQRQRVALARAMVKKPKVFLMDEPLSNLDAKLRSSMRVELIQLHKKLGTTFVYVTHDQVEAMSMGDAIVLMDKGVIMQYSTPQEIYNNPENVYTAQFIGAPPMNILRGLLPNGYSLGFRPERVRFFEEEDGELFALKGKIRTKEHLGAEINYSVETEYGIVMAKMEQEAEDDSNVLMRIPCSRLYVFDDHDRRVPMTDEVKDALKQMENR